MASLFRNARHLARLGRAACASSAFTGGVRGFADAAAQEAPKSGGGGGLWLGLAALAAGGGGYYAYSSGLFGDSGSAVPGVKKELPAVKDYDKVRAAIADILDAPEGYDDGSYGPILVRLAWHSSGTYDKETGTGGSNGATMRYDPDRMWAANAGLGVARDLLEPIKKQFPWISYADLWTLAGAVAVEEMGGPKIEWRPGRSDHLQEEYKAVLPDGRLPDADKDAAHLRKIFYRMGFDDREIVALSGAHTLGRCHTDRSGYTNPWTNAPTTFSNLYFQDLLNKKWRKKKWNGPVQYEDPTGELMMLPTDMALIWDKKFKPYVQDYAKDEEKFFKDFAAAFAKLMELGVPYPAAPNTGMFPPAKTAVSQAG